MGKRISGLILLAAGWCFAAQAAGDREAAGADPAAEIMRYDQPASKFYEALPLGSGRLGAMVFGGVDEERIVLNESSVWSGSPQDADRPDAYK
ncbi:MAG: glycoside hydrolase N-terminal domain-containing protein, partial [Kiritimatiellales bacterium]